VVHRVTEGGKTRAFDSREQKAGGERRSIHRAAETGGSEAKPKGTWRLPRDPAPPTPTAEEQHVNKKVERWKSSTVDL